MKKRLPPFEEKAEDKVNNAEELNVRPRACKLMANTQWEELQHFSPWFRYTTGNYECQAGKLHY